MFELYQNYIIVNTCTIKLIMYILLVAQGCVISLVRHLHLRFHYCVDGHCAYNKGTAKFCRGRTFSLVVDVQSELWSLLLTFSSLLLSLLPLPLLLLPSHCHCCVCCHMLSTSSPLLSKSSPLLSMLSVFAITII